MSVQCGVDIIEIDRVKKTIEKTGKSFLDKVFTEDENNYCVEKNAVMYKSYAARFAAKEAVVKALGTGIDCGIEWTDIEISVDNLGKPFPVLRGNAKKLYDEMKGKSIALSLSHCDLYAVAYAVIETY